MSFRFDIYMTWWKKKTSVISVISIILFVIVFVLTIVDVVEYGADEIALWGWGLRIAAMVFCIVCSVHASAHSYMTGETTCPVALIIKDTVRWQYGPKRDPDQTKQYKWESLTTYEMELDDFLTETDKLKELIIGDVHSDHIWRFVKKDDYNAVKHALERVWQSEIYKNNN